MCIAHLHRGPGQKSRSTKFLVSVYIMCLLYNSLNVMDDFNETCNECFMCLLNSGDVQSTLHKGRGQGQLKF